MLKLILILLALSLVFFSCRSDALGSEDVSETKTFISHDTIPEIRDSVNKNPIASYTSPSKKLEVKVYETKQTFQFLMIMDYQFLDEPDTLRIPNFGIRPTIVIKEGADKQSCIVGFFDIKKEFKEYKLVTVKTGNLQVKVLKRYFAGVYKTTYPDTTASR